MLQPADEVLNLIRTHVSGRKRQRRSPAKSALWSGQPSARSLGSALEELECARENSGEPDETIGLLRTEATLLLAPRQRSRGDLSQLGKSQSRKRRVSLEMLERRI